LESQGLQPAVGYVQNWDESFG